MFSEIESHIVFSKGLYYSRNRYLQVFVDSNISTRVPVKIHSHTEGRKHNIDT